MPRSLLLLSVLAAGLSLAAPAVPAADIGSAEDCQRAIDADAPAAREAAAVWARSGGGVAARLCEAAALEAMGATASAARILTALAQNPNRAMDRDLRLVTLADGARLWLEAGVPGEAAAALDAADRIGPATPERQILRARVAAARSDWPAALGALEPVLAADPANGAARALRAAALRLSGDAAAAEIEADRARSDAPDSPEALFEAAAARAELGNRTAAARLWLDLIERFPESGLVAVAQRNLQSLQQR